MAEANSIQLAFEKLSGRENYNNWKFGMKMTLVHENLWRCIEGYSEEDKTKEIEKERFDQKALAKICLMVKPSAYPHVRSAKTAQEAWNNLERAYEDKGLSRRLSLIRGLVRVRLKKFPTMESYVNEAMSLAQKLADMGQPIDDEFLGVILLSGLTSEYDPMVMAIENSGAKITSDFIKAKLLQDDKYGKENKDGSESALFSKKKTQAKKHIKCFNCGLLGHYKSQCKKTESHENNKQKYQRTDESKDKNIKTEKRAEKALQIIEDSKNPLKSISWFIDSGATSHMTYQEELLQFSKNKVHSEILTANNQSILGLNVGDATVSTVNGLKKVTDVLHVPDLRADLLSVSKMVEKGHAVVFDLNGCTVYDADKFQVEGDIVLTGSNKNGLYELNSIQQQHM